MYLSAISFSGMIFLCFSFLSSCKPYREVDRTVMNAVVKKLEDVRGLPATQPIQSRLAVSTDFIKVYSKKFEKALAEGVYKRNEEALRALGFLPTNIDLGSTEKSRFSNLVAGFYSSAEKILWVLLRTTSTNPGQVQRAFRADQLATNPTLVHELNHALVDQHFDIQKFRNQEEQKNTDLLLARRAVIEGDAQYTTFLYRGGNTKNYIAYENARSGAIISAYIKNKILHPLPSLYQFPYLHGGLFVSVLVKEGGFAKLNQAYEDPPNSTSEIMHVSRYLFGPRVKVRLPVLTSLLNQFETNSTVLLEDTLGEFRLGLLLSHFINEEEAIKDAVEGWSGDRFAVLKQENGTPLILFASVWEGEDNAKEFSQVLINWILTKNPAIKWEELSESSALAKNGEHYIGVLQQGEGVVWVEGVSQNEISSLLLELLDSIPDAIN